MGVDPKSIPSRVRDPPPDKAEAGIPDEGRLRAGMLVGKSHVGCPSRMSPVACRLSLVACRLSYPPVACPTRLSLVTCPTRLSPVACPVYPTNVN